MKNENPIDCSDPYGVAVDYGENISAESIDNLIIPNQDFEITIAGINLSGMSYRLLIRGAFYADYTAEKILNGDLSSLITKNYNDGTKRVEVSCPYNFRLYPHGGELGGKSEYYELNGQEVLTKSVIEKIKDIDNAFVIDYPRTWYGVCRYPLSSKGTCPKDITFKFDPQEGEITYSIFRDIPRNALGNLKRTLKDKSGNVTSNL